MTTANEALWHLHRVFRDRYDAWRGSSSRHDQVEPSLEDACMVVESLLRDMDPDGWAAEERRDRIRHLEAMREIYGVHYRDPERYPLPQFADWHAWAEQHLAEVEAELAALKEEKT